MTSQVIDVHEELADAKVGAFHWRLGAIMGLLTLFDGYDTFNPAYVIHYVAGPWGLKAGQAGLLISSGLVGFLLGAALHGVAADKFGRRGTLLAGLWITSVFTLLTAVLANSFISFCALRLLTGLGLGVLLPLATTYINELAPRRVANTFALWGVALGWAAGGTLAGVVGVFATPALGWTSLYWIGSLSFLLLPFMHVMLPESPKFLAIQGRVAGDPRHAGEAAAGARAYLCDGDHCGRQQAGVGQSRSSNCCSRATAGPRSRSGPPPSSACSASSASRAGSRPS